MKTHDLVLPLALLLSLAPALVAAQSSDPEPSTPPEHAEAQAQNEVQDPSAKPADQDTPSGKAEDETPAMSPHVRRAVFTHDVRDHEPIDEVQAVPAGTETIYFFTEIADLEGSSIVHRWSKDGEVVAEVPIEIGGPRWRVYSHLEPGPKEDPGTYTVEILDDQGNSLGKAELEYGKVDESAGAAQS